MNNSEWLKKAKCEIEKLTPGEIFEVKELFKGAEWNSLSAKERQAFGRYFSSNFNDGLLPNIERYRPNAKGPNRYRYIGKEKII